MKNKLAVIAAIIILLAAAEEIYSQDLLQTVNPSGLDTLRLKGKVASLEDGNSIILYIPKTSNPVVHIPIRVNVQQYDLTLGDWIQVVGHHEGIKVDGKWELVVAADKVRMIRRGIKPY